MTIRIPFALGTAALLALASGCGTTLDHSFGPEDDAGPGAIDDSGNAVTSESAAPEASTTDASSGLGGEGGGVPALAGQAGGLAPDGVGPAITPIWVNPDSSRRASVLYGQLQTWPIGGVVVAIRVDPRSADTVYVATASAGVWKSTDFTSAAPNWTPITDGVGLATGAIDLDPRQPDTVYVGLNDIVRDGKHNGVFKSVDGGAHWGELVALSSGQPALMATKIQDLSVDPSNSWNVLVATDIGLLRSTDSGASFSLVPLPDACVPAGNHSVYSVAYAGAHAGKSTWVAAGLCQTGFQGGNLWRSTDSGATWISLRGYGGLPIPKGDIHRMTVRAGRPVEPSRTVLYAMADRLAGDSSGLSGAGTTVLYRSTDGGAHFTLLADRPLTFPWGECNRIGDVLGTQGSAAQAIAIDPTDDNHVLFGGEKCSIRTLNGLGYDPQFAVSSDWVESPNGPPYVHSEWHAAAASVSNGLVRVYSGTNGGLASSTNLWTTPVGQESAIVWRNDNGGMNTQVGVSVASGDPLSRNPEAVLTGLWDNGHVLGVLKHADSAFYHFGLGNGTGSAIGKGTLGQFFWAGWYFCSGSAASCGSSAWPVVAPPLPIDDSPDDMRQSAVQTEPSGATILMTSLHNVWRSDWTPAWTNLSGTHCDLDGKACTTGGFPYAIRSLFASQTIRGLYGVGFYDNRAAVTSEGERANPTWSISATTPANDWITGIAFPATVPAGEQPGDTYVISTNQDGPAPNGHLFITRDRGRTWLPIRGNASGADLPNVNARVVRFDPSDRTNRTLYVGLVTGVYRTTDGGATWSPFGTGLPQAVDIVDIYVARDGSFLRAAASGRGLWEIAPR